jgi:hypothetical protein
VSTTFPPHEPGRHGWAELLTLVGAIRRLAVRPHTATAGSAMQNPGRVPRLRPRLIRDTAMARTGDGAGRRSLRLCASDP